MFIPKAYAGCTPCECGVPGACAQESLPWFLQFIPAPLLHLGTYFFVPLITALIPAFIAYIALGRLGTKLSRSTIRTAAVGIGALFVLPSVFDALNPTYAVYPSPVIPTIIALAAIYGSLTLYDLKRGKYSLSGALSGALVIMVIVGGAMFGYKFTMASRHEEATEKREQVIEDVLKSVGVATRSVEVQSILKQKNYTQLTAYLHPTKEFEVYFRDYSGARFKTGAFQEALAAEKLGQILAYHRVDDYKINTQQLLESISEFLNGDSKVQYYIDNRQYVDGQKSMNEYKEATYLYSRGSAYVTVLFTRDESGGNWYLSKIGYYDPQYPGY